jgi:hypothetical protein
MHQIKQTGKGNHSCSCGVSGDVATMLAHV